MDQLNLILNAVVNETPTAELNESIKKLSQNPKLQELKLNIDINEKELNNIADAIKKFQNIINKDSNIKIFDFAKLEKEGKQTFANFTELINHFKKIGQVRVPEKILDPVTREVQALTLLVDKGSGQIDKMRINLVQLQKDGQKMEPRLMVSSLQELKPTDNLAKQKELYDQISKVLNSIYQKKTQILSANEETAVELKKQLIEEGKLYAKLDKEKIGTEGLTYQNDAQEKQLEKLREKLQKDYQLSEAGDRDKKKAEHVKMVNQAYKEQADIIDALHNVDVKIAKTKKDEIATLRELNAEKERLEGSKNLNSQNIQNKGYSDLQKENQLAILAQEKRKELALIEAKILDTKVKSSKIDQQDTHYKQQEDAIKRIHILEKQMLDAKKKGQTEIQAMLQEEMVIQKNRAEDSKNQIHKKGLQDTKEEAKLTELIRKNEAEITIEKTKQSIEAQKVIEDKQRQHTNKYGEVDQRLTFTGTSKEEMEAYARTLNSTGTILRQKFKVGVDEAGNAVNQLTIEMKEADNSTKKYTLTALEADKVIRTQQESTAHANKKDLSIAGMFNEAMKKYPIWIAATMAWQGFISETRKGIQYIYNMDTALTDLIKVSDLTDVQLNKLRETSIKLGKELGKSSVDIMKSYAEIGRAYKDPKEMEEMSRVDVNAPSYSNV
jgi:hypothetical protein